jgi:hypothetical protein
MRFFGPLLVRVIPFILLLFAASLPASAGPGAHGPNGEHLDGPAAGAAGTDSTPRMEAKSEAFELVARLGGGELSILIDRFETNEPVLNAQVEVESGKLKAVAKFHADQGDYAVDDAALLSVLGQPGAHPIVVTLLAGKESDLLEGTLQVTTAVSVEPGHGHSHEPGGGHEDEHAAINKQWRVPALVFAAIVAIGLLLFFRRKRHAASIEESK